MRYKFFVFSDVHGEYNALIDSLAEAGYDADNPNHQLISLGDNFDRGPDSKKVYELLNKFSKKAICVKGNHDVMFQEYLEKGMDGEYVLFNIIHNGLGATIRSFSQLPKSDIINVKDFDMAKNFRQSDKVLEWLQNLPLYFETKNYIFVHAGVEPNLSNWKDTPEDFILWDIEKSHLPCPNTLKTVVIGHHHTFRVRQNAERDGFKERKPAMNEKFYGNEDEHRPYCYGNKIALDGCSNYTHKVNVMVIEDELLEDLAQPENTQQDTDIKLKFDTGIEQGIDWAQYTTGFNYNTVYTTTTDGNGVYFR